jgi:hydrogenase nickel incorporation protein HypA/HybF
MHEMGIANSILEAVRTEAQRFPGGHISKVGVRIGELAGVDPDSMSFCFDALVRETDLEPLAIEIEYCSRSHQCRDCRGIFPAPLEGARCPSCGGTDSVFVAGDELELSYLEVEDGTSLSGT